MIFVANGRDYFYERFALGVIPFFILWLASSRDWSAIGFSKPLQSFRYWLKITAILAIFGALAGAIGYIFRDHLAQRNMTWKFENWADAGSWFLMAGIRYPAVEELLYRGLFCTIVFPRIGFWPTVLLNGVVFAFLHYLYGAAEPVNMVGGFLLSFAFLKSESIWVPLILHSLGNVAAGLTHLP